MLNHLVALIACEFLKVSFHHGKVSDVSCYGIRVFSTFDNEAIDHTIRPFVCTHHYTWQEFLFLKAGLLQENERARFNFVFKTLEKPTRQL